MEEFAEKVVLGSATLKLLRNCYDCGECKKFCPVTQRTLKFNPRRIARIVISKPLTQVCSEREIWLCANCALCDERCPYKVPFSRIVVVIRNIAASKGYIPEDFKESASMILKTGRAIPLTKTMLHIRETLGLPPPTHLDTADINKILRLTGLLGRLGSGG